MFYGLLVEKWTAVRQGQGKRYSKGVQKQRRRGGPRLRVEPLEARQMLSISPLGFARLMPPAMPSAMTPLPSRSL